MVLKKVDLFLHTTLYDTCKVFTTGFAEALTRLGVVCRLFDVEDGDMREYIQQIIADPPDCTFCFTTKGRFQGTLFCESVGIPHFCYLIDAAVYFNELTRVPNLVMGAIDEYDCELQRKYGGIENIFFLPHAFDKDLAWDPDTDRPYEVTMIGALFDYEKMRNAWPNLYPEALVEVMETVVHRVLGDSHTHFVFAFLEEVAKKQVPLENVDIREVLQQIEGYFRSYDRISLIKSIKDAHVHVFGPVLLGGKGWSEYLDGHKNVAVHPPVSYLESLDIIRKSRILLNSSPSYKRGGHERVFNGLGLGALVLATDNLYLPTQLKEGEDILYYRSGNLRNVNEIVCHYLHHEQERKQIVLSGRDKVLQQHTWDHRAAVFLKEMPAYLAAMQNARD